MSTSYCCGPGAREERFREKLDGASKSSSVKPSDRALDIIIPIIKDIEFSPSKVMLEASGGIFADWFISNKKIELYIDGEDEFHDYVEVVSSDTEEGVFPANKLKAIIVSSTAKKL